jgi:hypothetical protein
MSYSKEQLDEMHAEYATTFAKCDRLFESYVLHNFHNARAKEYATHGYLRRLKTLLRCLQNLFELLPPDRADIPGRDKLTDATINIQALVFNVFGCSDNLARVWVSEKEITCSDGSTLPRMSVGLSAKCKVVRKSFSGEMQTYLASLDAWFKGLGEYRDALAHRIPLYIPPYAVPKSKVAEYQELERQMVEAIKQRNFAERKHLEIEQQKLIEFRPLITHSFNETEGTILFHPQMLADYNLAVELGEKMLAELAR